MNIATPRLRARVCSADLSCRKLVRRNRIPGSCKRFQEFKAQFGVVQIRCVLWLPRATGILAAGLSTSTIHKEEAQCRCKKPRRCYFCSVSPPSIPRCTVGLSNHVLCRVIAKCGHHCQPFRVEAGCGLLVQLFKHAKMITVLVITLFLGLNVMEKLLTRRSRNDDACTRMLKLGSCEMKFQNKKHLIRDGERVVAGGESRRARSMVQYSVFLCCCGVFFLVVTHRYFV